MREGGTKGTLYVVLKLSQGNQGSKYFLVSSINVGRESTDN